MLHELQDEETGYEEIDAETPALDLGASDVVAVRAMMIRLQQLDRQTEKVQATRDAVVAAYAEQLDRIERDRQWLRSSLQAWLERYGETTKTGGRKIRFPDVGTASLAKGDPKVDVADREAFRGELGAMFTKEVFDETDAKRYALALALDGKPIPAGVNVVPGGPQLRIRKA